MAANALTRGLNLASRSGLRWQFLIAVGCGLSTGLTTWVCWARPTLERVEAQPARNRVRFVEMNVVCDCEPQEPVEPTSKP